MRFIRRRHRPVFTEPESGIRLPCAEPGCDQQIEYGAERERILFFQRSFEDWGGASPEMKVVYLMCRNGHNHRYEVRMDGAADA